MYLLNIVLYIYVDYATLLRSIHSSRLLILSIIKKRKANMNKQKHTNTHIDMPKTTTALTTNTTDCQQY